MKTLLAIVVLVVVAGAAWFLLAGRGSESAVSLGQPPGQTTSTTQTTQATGTLPRSRSLEVWFARDGRLVEALRTHAPTRRVATAALRGLLAGPTPAERAAGLGTEIPRATRLLDVSIANGVAKVDLTSDYEAGADSRSLQLRLAQVVYTLTQFPTVKAVRFELDGAPANVFSSAGIVLSHPVGRSDYESLAPVVSPLAGSWRPLARAPIGAPTGRASVWTGRELLVLGRARGARVFVAYQPSTNAWRRLAPPPGPGSGPYRAAWTGKEMLVWGRATHAAFNPATGRWRQLASPPAGLAPAVAIWTGHELIGWRGEGAAAYRPATDSWRSLRHAPLRGETSSAGAWTGRELIVVSGARAAAYSPATDSWRLLAPLPEARAGASAVWDGGELLVVGGKNAPTDGFAYDPGTNRWRRLAPMDAGRAGAAAVWTGKRLLLWGGETGSPGAFVIPPHGLAYDPRADDWSPLPQAPLRGRLDPVGAWTGRSLLVWGGDPGFADGAAFTPLR
jgi:spore germination protein GerM